MLLRYYRVMSVLNVTLTGPIQYYRDTWVTSSITIFI